MTCEEITTALMSWAASNTQEIVVPNYYIGTWECDVMKISKAGQMTEYEIKTSRSDFKKDAEKCRSTYNYETHQRTLLGKHEAIQQGKRCNRFYFVVPAGLVQPSEVPDGMGLIYAEIKGNSQRGTLGNVDYMRFKIVKVSKLFKKEPVHITIYQQVARNLSLKLTNQKRVSQQWRKSYTNAVKTTRL